ncbi:MAG: chemotaxis protein CheW [Rhodocyclales bacterium]|nr:chemotaxis protein CheW [Rhodocyclales bacterium]
MSVIVASVADPVRRTAVLPSEALNRFQPPEGFAPVATGTVAKKLRYGFRAVGLSMLIREGMPSEVLPMMPYAAIPNGPGWLLGMINLHGTLVPVCDLRRVLETGAEGGSAKPMILVLDKGDKAAGFVIDGYPCAVTGLRPTSQVSGLPDLLGRHVTATLATDDEVWLEFDHAGFLDGANQQ